MRIQLIRVEESSKGTFGVLKIDGEAFCVTLEPPDNENYENISCIPENIYFCRRIVSRKFADTFMVKNVFGRTDILFHAGNVLEDTKGCIVLGQHFGKLRGDRAVLNSGNTFQQFMRKLDGLKIFILEVKGVMR